MNLKLLIAAVLLVLMFFFVLQNTQVVEINFLLWSVSSSRVIIYLSIFLIGMLTGWLGNSLHRRYRA